MKKKKNDKPLAKFSEAGLLVFRQAVPAINGPALGWLKRYFAVFSAVCTDYLCHFTGAHIAGTAALAKI